jgi:hypothetical protein
MWSASWLLGEGVDMVKHEQFESLRDAVGPNNNWRPHIRHSTFTTIENWERPLVFS